MAKIGDRLKHAWNAFVSQDKEDRPLTYPGVASYSARSDRQRFNFANGKSIVSAIYTRIGIDVGVVDIRHVRLDDDDLYQEDVNDGLNYCLTQEPNIDQSAFDFRQDVIMTLFDEGVAALVPIDTTFNPSISGSYDIKTMRVGRITGWYPRHVRVSVYNDVKGMREEITVEKSYVAIIQNPLYSVMNEPNSTLQRLIRKLNLLDVVDEQSSSGKLDLIIQLPYVIKSPARRQQAEERRTDIEMQLKGSKYGIAYTDGTEKITQLNRPAENNLLEQVTYLTQMLYGQLGITDTIMNGTADELTMNNYYARTIEPLLIALTQAMKRSFLTKTARSQGQSIAWFRNPFKFASIADMADAVDKFSRNEVFSSNDFRGFMGIKPSKDPKANQLINSNMPQPPPAAPVDASAPTDASAPPDNSEDGSDDTSSIMQNAFAQVNSSLDDVFSGLGVDENDLS